MDFRNIASFLNVDKNEAEALGCFLADTLKSDLEKIRRGIRESDAESISFAAHSIKGASGNLGFNRLSQLAEELETLAQSGKLEGLEIFLFKMQDFLETLESSLSGT